MKPPNRACLDTLHGLHGALGFTSIVDGQCLCVFTTAPSATPALGHTAPSGDLMVLLQFFFDFLRVASENSDDEDLLWLGMEESNFAVEVC